MSAEVGRRLELARRIALPPPPGVRAVVVGGSVADGTADTRSDTDIYFCWRGGEPAPTSSTLRSLDGAIPVWRNEDSAGHFGVELWVVEGQRVEVTHFAHASIEAAIVALSERAEPLGDDQASLRALLDGVVLHGEEEIAAIRQRLLPYPDRLAEAVVAANLRFRPHRYFSMAIERDSPVYVHRLVTLTLESVMGVLLGLNRIYGSPSEAKQLDRLSRHMAHAPRDLPDRARRIVTAAPVDIAADLDAMVRELFALVDRHLPTVRTSAAWALYDLPLS